MSELSKRFVLTSGADLPASNAAPKTTAKKKAAKKEAPAESE